MTKVRKALVVNPDSSSGNPAVRTFRQPEPASREEKFTVPASKASDGAFSLAARSRSDWAFRRVLTLLNNFTVAQNPYHKRDFRRQYPKTEFVSQSELATLLISQSGFTSCVLLCFCLPCARLDTSSSTSRLPDISSSDKSTTALTADSPAPSLAALYNSSSAVAAPSFKPPTPPGLKFR